MTTKRIVTNLDEEELKMLDEIQSETGFSAYKIVKKSIRLFHYQFKKSQKKLVHNQNETVSDSAYALKDNEPSTELPTVKLSPDDFDDALDRANIDHEHTKSVTKIQEMAESMSRKVHVIKHVTKHAPELASSNVDEIERKLDDAFNF